MKKIVDRIVVDNISGELIDSSTTFVKVSVERYMMLRLSDGVEWVGLISGRELMLLIALGGLCNGNGLVELSGGRRKRMMTMLGIKDSMFRRLIRGLMDKRFVKEVGKGDFYINPRYVFKCSVKDLTKKIEFYDNILTL